MHRDGGAIEIVDAGSGAAGRANLVVELNAAAMPEATVAPFWNLADQNVSNDPKASTSLQFLLTSSGISEPQTRGLGGQSILFRSDDNATRRSGNGLFGQILGNAVHANRRRDQGLADRSIVLDHAPFQSELAGAEAFTHSIANGDGGSAMVLSSSRVVSAAC